MSTSATPPAPKFTLADIFQYALEIVQDVEVELDPHKPAEAKRQALLNAVSVALEAYLDAKGKQADQKVLYGYLVTLVDSGLGLYRALGF